MWAYFTGAGGSIVAAVWVVVNDAHVGWHADGGASLLVSKRVEQVRMPDAIDDGRRREQRRVPVLRSNLECEESAVVVQVSRRDHVRAALSQSVERLVGDGREGRPRRRSGEGHCEDEQKMSSERRSTKE